MRLLVKTIAVIALMASSIAAQAQNYSFNCISGNNAADCAIGESQLGLAVTDNGSTVDFRFFNLGPLASSITDIYFDWASASFALVAGTITDSGSGVAFDWGAAPPDLPGGNAISFSADLAADSTNPTQPMGVNPSEWLNIRFDSSADLIAGLNSSQLRVGIHVQGFDGGGSESFVATPVPEPETYSLLLAGLALLGFVARRRQRGACT